MEKNSIYEITAWGVFLLRVGYKRL